MTNELPLKKHYLLSLFFALVFQWNTAQQVLVYHTIQTDQAGNMIPWYNADPGISYDHDLQLIWNFWNNIPTNQGTKFYMMDHAYSPTLQGSMVGGDQFAMALSSWSLLYAYTGDTTIVENMTYIANTYLQNSLSLSTDAWPNLPYPDNYTHKTLPIYDGDYIQGAGVTQPDKAGSFGNELVTLFKITGDTSYLTYAVNIANTLAQKIQPGDAQNSPYPFKVNAQTGSLPSNFAGLNFTTDFAPTLTLFESLGALGEGNRIAYDSAYTTLKTWIQTYPQQNNNWGCFFEDIPLPSNTETNAVTMARYILNHPNWSNTYQQDARSILDWTFNTFKDTDWNQYGATAIFEQSVDLKPGGSHTSRYAATELLYTEITGDTTHRAEAIRELNWATYLCDTSGQVRFSPSENSVWYTDGYGDYVRHFLRAMGAYPVIAPFNANHLLQTSSVITYINYQPLEIEYRTYDNSSYETLRLTSKPLQVIADGAQLSEQSNLDTQGWMWTPYSTGGALQVRHNNGHNVRILWTPEAVSSIEKNELTAQLYPNPAQSHVDLNYTLNHTENVEIELLDVDGQKLKGMNVRGIEAVNNIQLIDITGLPSGVYFVKLTAEDGTCLKKLVITRK